MFFLIKINGQSGKDSTPSFVNEFLNIGVGARSHGMFGSMVANDESVTSAFWNPAGLAGMKSSLSVNAMHASWFGGISNYDYLSIGKKINEDNQTTLALSLIRMGIDNIPNTLNLIGPDGSVNFQNITSFSAADYAFFLSMGKNFKSEKLRIGGSIKLINRNIGSFAKAWGFGADLGLQYRASSFSLGLMLKDITSTFNSWTFNLSEEEKQVFAQTGNVIPESSTEVALPRIILGLAYHGESGAVSYLLESDLNISTNAQEAGLIGNDKFSFDPTIGAEIGFSKKVYVRAGVGNIQRLINVENTSTTDLVFQPNVGLGLNFGRFHIDYALTNLGGNEASLVSHVFSLQLDFLPRNARY